MSGDEVSRFEHQRQALHEYRVDIMRSHRYNHNSLNTDCILYITGDEHHVTRKVYSYTDQQLRQTSGSHDEEYGRDMMIAMMHSCTNGSCIAKSYCVRRGNYEMPAARLLYYYQSLVSCANFGLAAELRWRVYVAALR